MNFKDWWEHNKSEYFYSEEDLAEDAYTAGFMERQHILQAHIQVREDEIQMYRRQIDELKKELDGTLYDDLYDEKEN